MKVKKVLESLRADPDNQTRLKYAAADLGAEVFHHRKNVIRELRAGLAPLRPFSVFGKGYLAALADVAAAFHTRLLLENDKTSRKKKS